jgi:hypothetical protein
MHDGDLPRRAAETDQSESEPISDRFSEFRHRRVHAEILVSKLTKSKKKNHNASEADIEELEY